MQPTMKTRPPSGWFFLASLMAGCLALGECDGFAQESPARSAVKSEEPAKDAPFRIGDQKQLFIDDRFMASSSGISLVVNPPVKEGPITLSTPVTGYVNGIIEHAGRYLMYYRSAGGYAVATSTDGINWECPVLEGSKSGRSIVFPGCEEGGVFLDPKDTEGFPFKAIFGIMPAATAAWGRNLAGWTAPDLPPQDGKTKPNISGGLYLFRSKDGLHWECIPKVAVPFLCDTSNQAFYDSRLDRYVAYLRGFPEQAGSPYRNKRVAVRTETASLLDMPWPFRRNAARPLSPSGCYSYPYDEMDIVLAADARDPARTDLYNPCVHLYSHAQDVYLAFPSMFRCYGYGEKANSHGRDFRGQADGDGLFEVQLAVSRDGIHFERFRQPYVKPGLLRETRGTRGDLDRGLVTMGVGMIRRGDELYQYYEGRPSTHVTGAVAEAQQGPDNAGAVFRVVQRLDGFISADAGPDGGELLTPPVVFSGGRLALNADCGGSGEIWVELQDQQGHGIPGFTMAEAVSIDRNGTAQEVWWKQGPDTSALAGKPIRLRIKMRSAKLYAFQFTKPTPAAPERQQSAPRPPPSPDRPRGSNKNSP